MSDQKKTTNAAEILRRRYIKDDPGREASVQEERVNADVAQMIYDLRTEAELTQSQLAKLVGTTQSAISRLEDTDYEGHSLSMLRKVARALNRRILVSRASQERQEPGPPLVFRILMHDLRRWKQLTVDQLSARTDIPREDIAGLERDEHYRPSPLILYRLAQFYDIPDRRLAQLAGAIREVPVRLQEQASRFAAQSDSFATLTKQEKRAVDVFIGVLREETD